MIESCLSDISNCALENLISGAAFGFAFGIGYVPAERLLEKILKLDIKLFWIRNKKKPKMKQVDVVKSLPTDMPIMNEQQKEAICVGV